MIDRLKEYIKKDEIYQEYKKGELINASDFDNFCIQHCKDIEELLEKNEELKEQQQEFINYLKENIDEFNFRGILAKYKEIFGVKDES